jgi:hypothetical protein
MRNRVLQDFISEKNILGIEDHVVSTFINRNCAPRAHTHTHRVLRICIKEIDFLAGERYL